MKTHRRQFLKNSSVTLAAASFLGRSTFAAEAPARPSFISRPPKLKLGTVTYNLAKDWDIPTIIKNCTEANSQGV